MESLKEINHLSTIRKIEIFLFKNQSGVPPLVCTMVSNGDNFLRRIVKYNNLLLKNTLGNILLYWRRTICN